MKRKDFLRGTCGLTALFGSWMAGGTVAFGQEQGAGVDEKKVAAFRKFVHGYIKSLMDNLDKNLPEAERTAVQEANGRACAARGGSVDWVKSFGGDIDKFLAEMRKLIGDANAVRDGRTVRLTYEKCFCPLVAELKEPISPSYCLCTQGWTKAVYEALTGKPVRVALRRSIKRGDPKCLIEVEIA
jgi:predicted hydrocarbon binding protein